MKPKHLVILSNCIEEFRFRQERVMERLKLERDEWKAKYIQQNKDLKCEMMDPNGTIWDHAQTLQRERDDARRLAERFAAGHDVTFHWKNVEVEARRP